MISGVQLHAAGLQQPGVRARLARETLFEIVPKRVYALSPEVTPDGLRAAALLATTGWRALSHWSAAEMLEIWTRSTVAHHVTTTGRTRSIPRVVTVHRTRVELPVRRIRGLPVTEPGRVVLDLAVDLRGRGLEKLIGNAGYRRLIPKDLSEILGRYPGHRGAANLRDMDLSAALRRRTETPLEDEVLALLDTLPIPGPICQEKVTGHSGRRYRADFAWPDRRLILEADGRSAHERELAMDADRARDLDLQAAGWVTMRVTGRQLRRERGQFVSSLLAVFATGV